MDDDKIYKLSLLEQMFYTAQEELRCRSMGMVLANMNILFSFYFRPLVSPIPMATSYVFNIYGISYNA